ncbi:hypothetical protein NKH58_30170, partial [Mesorhizobium australicum]
MLRQTLQHKVAHLRAFLRFCGDRGKTARGLERIDTPRTYRGELPPRALDWEVIEKLLSSVARTDYLGRRHHAILHLMAYYGLRPSEIAAQRWPEESGQGVKWTVYLNAARIAGNQE